jgi:hypothetical protein
LVLVYCTTPFDFTLATEDEFVASSVTAIGISAIAAIGISAIGIVLLITNTIDPVNASLAFCIFCKGYSW